ncbi:MAG TPA: autotransporter domain-containing protein [Caulobacteraceae bacterium]|nr:autotransporter domain-containing protein [Caulobacteraceae bacterium]
MSLSKSATRRTALFTSSSLVAAGIATAAALGTGLAPTIAVAQATCVSTPAPSGNGTNTVAITGSTTTTAGTTYNPSIDCTYIGTGATVSTTGNITVSTTAPGGGVNLTAVGAGAVNWNSTAGTVTGSTQTNGPVIDATTSSGAININTAAVTGSSATVSHAIRATSTAGGAVSVTTNGAVSATNTTSGNTAIRAVSTGGNGAVTVTTNNPAQPASQAALVSGRLFGIYAETSGSGALTVDAHTRVSTTRATAADAAIEARTGTGLLTVNVEGVLGVNTSNGPAQLVATVSGGSGGAGIRSAAGGDAEINIGVFSDVRGAWGLDATAVAGTTTTVNIANYHSSDSRNWVSTADGNLTRMRAAGAGALVVNVDGVLWGAADLSALSGGAEINISGEGVWWTEGAAVSFGASDDRLVTEVGDGTEQAVGGIISVGSRAAQSFGTHYIVDPVHIIDFGAGDDIFENGGYLMVSGAAQANAGSGDISGTFEGETRLVGLETFVNSGTIFLGVYDNGSGTGDNSDDPSFNRGYHLDDVSRWDEGVGGIHGPTDGFHDDILSLPGTTFVGDGGEIYFDIDVSKTQSNCQRDPTTGELAAADCVIIAGGATEGVHYVNFREPVPGDRGQFNPEGIVIAEVTGGTSAQGHFAISPGIRGYSAQSGGMLDKGFYAYMIGYKADTQQHVLVSIPGPSAYQLPLLAQGGHSLWRLSTGSWFDRQADIRGQQDGRGGAWLRASGETADRDMFQDVTAAGTTFSFDNTYTQTSYAVTGGADLLFGASGDTAFLAGVMLGYANSEFEYEDSPNFGRIDAWTLGTYGSIVSGGLFVDMAVNANRAMVDDDVPGADLFPAGTILSTEVLTLGTQLEAGLRLPLLAEGVFIEPLIGFSYVWSNWEDLYLPTDNPNRTGITAEIGDPNSTRAGVGARLGLDRDLGPVRAEIAGLWRLWEEFGNETTVTLIGPGEDPTIGNDFTGRFNELSLGASLYRGPVSGFLRLGAKLADDYEAQTASAGVRVAF